MTADQNPITPDCYICDADETARQKFADGTTGTLRRLARIRKDLLWLQEALDLLSAWADHYVEDTAVVCELGNASQAAACLLDVAPEVVRDVASTLPLRGLEYGEDDQ